MTEAHTTVPATQSTGDTCRRFQWRSRDGKLYYTEEMETRHLFLTLRMIWNHTVALEYRIQPYTVYEFGPHYTVGYMAEAVRALSAELVTRRDMEDRWVSSLKYIYDRSKELFSSHQ